MPNANSVESLRKAVLGEIGRFLFKEGFQTHNQIEEALIITIDEVSGYYEEGQLLFPEVLVVNNFETIMQLIPHERIKIGNSPIVSSNFKMAIKQCAPLCKEGWVMYIDLEAESMSYGLISAELTSISLTLLDQLKSLGVEGNDYCIAYIRRNSATSVEVQGKANSIIIEFSLKQPSEEQVDHIDVIAKGITKNAEETDSINSIYYVKRILSDAARSGHGNLIGVIDSAPECLLTLKQIVPEGIYLESPLDICDMLKLLHEEKSSQSDFRLRLYISAIKSMINNDGITVFNNKAQLIGYHLLIPSNQTGSASPSLKEGTGTRSKAFEAMKLSEAFISGFFKSQDGRENSF